MIESCPKHNLFISWLIWQFYEEPKKILKNWANFLYFTFNYFSFPQLIKTLFSPWRKYVESYGRGFDAQRYLEVFIGNIMTRLLGFVVRIFIIFIGLIAEFFVLIFGICILFVWLILPVLTIIGVITGFYLLMSS